MGLSRRLISDPDLMFPAMIKRLYLPVLSKLSLYPYNLRVLKYFKSRHDMP